MQPLKPEEKTAILANRPQAQPADIEEYERLLSQRFATDPNIPSATPAKPQPFAAPLAAPPEKDREARLKELHCKLYG